jgi:TPR repeat protein
LKTFTTSRWTLVFAAAVLGAAGVALAATESASSQSIIKAIHKGDCDKAVKEMNAAMNSTDAEADFLAGRMLNEGVCVKQDSASAADYFKRALELGDRASALDYGTKIGLGEGAPQSYEHAGEVCRTSGLDAEGKLSTYSLGYACTVQGVAGMLLRENIPKRAFTGGVALVQFTPQGAAMQIRSTPHVGKGDPETGSNVGRPLVDARTEIEKAWKDALASVPKPDPAKLDNKAIDLPLDVEMTIEPGKDSKRAGNQGAVLQGELIPAWRSF